MVLLHLLPLPPRGGPRAQGCHQSEGLASSCLQQRLCAACGPFWTDEVEGATWAPSGARWSARGAICACRTNANAGRAVTGLLTDGVKIKLGGRTPSLEGPCPVSSIC